MFQGRKPKQKTPTKAVNAWGHLGRKLGSRGWMSVTHLNPLAVKVDDTNVKLFDRPATVVIFHLLLTVVGLPHKAKSAFWRKRAPECQVI